MYIHIYIYTYAIIALKPWLKLASTPPIAADRRAAGGGLRYDMSEVI